MRSRLVRAGLLAAVAIAAQAGSIPGGYVLDDDLAIVDNPVVNGALPARAAFVRDSWGQRGAAGAYRPLVSLSFRADFWLGGGKPQWLHAVNVLLHAAAVVAAYLALRKPAGENVALAAAAFAAVFAAPAEAVQSLVGRADVLLALFGLLGLFAHQRRGRLAAASACAALLFALGSKESALLLIPCWLVFDLLLPVPAALGERWGRLVGYAAVIGLHAVGRGAALGSAAARQIDPLRNPLAAAPWPNQALGAGRVLAEHYLPGLFDPTQRLYLCSAPECGPASAADPIAWIGLAAVALGIVAAVILAVRVPAASAGLCWCGLLFLPASNFLVAGPTVYAERVLYAPAFGLALALAAVSQTLAGRSRPWLAFGPLLAFGLGNAAALQLRHGDWRSAQALYPTALPLAPRSAVVQLNAGVARLERREFQEAEEHARLALSLQPRFAEALALLAVARDGQGDAAGSEALFLRALATTPAGGVLQDYAKFLGRHGRHAEAAAQLERALLQRPESVALRRQLKFHQARLQSPRDTPARPPAPP